MSPLGCEGRFRRLQVQVTFSRFFLRRILGLMKPPSEMPATAANLAALFIVTISALVAIRNVQAGTNTFFGFCFVMWIAARAANIFFGTQKYQPALFYSWFSIQERITYKHFALYIHRPKLAYFFSTTLHWLRIAAVAFIAIALWHALYIESALLALFMLFLSGTIASMYPDLYFEDAAKRGNPGATEMLHRLRHIQEVMNS